MVTAVVCGILCGVRGYDGLVEWLCDQPVDVWHWIVSWRRHPKKDSFRDLLMKLAPDRREQALRARITDELKLSDSPEVLCAVSLDGKALCGTLPPFERALHLLAGGALAGQR